MKNLTKAEKEFDQRIEAYYCGKATCLVCRGLNDPSCDHPLISNEERANDQRLKDQNPIDHLSFPDTMPCPECCNHSMPILQEQKVLVMKLSECPTFPPIRVGLKVKTPMGEGAISSARLVQPKCDKWMCGSVVITLDSGLKSTASFAAEEIEVLEPW